MSNNNKTLPLYQINKNKYSNNKLGTLHYNNIFVVMYHSKTGIPEISTRQLLVSYPGVF